MILGIALIGLLLIDHLQDGDFRQVGETVAQCTLMLAEPVLRNLLQRLVEIGLQIVHLLVDIGIVPGAGRVNDVLVPRQHLLDIAGQRAAGAEQVDLKHQRVQLVVLVQQMLQRGVGNDAAIPEMIGADLDHRQRRRQRAACHHVFGRDHFVLVVEVEEISAQHVDGADREMDLAAN